jgi:DNA-binding CsgD family transcriptional regulator
MDDEHDQRPPDGAPRTLWDGFADGHFSVIEQLERDGRTYLVARRNHERRPALTAREREVLVRTARGQSSAEIAAALHEAQAAVEAHLANAAQKLGLASRAALVTAAEAFAAGADPGAA